MSNLNKILIVVIALLIITVVVGSFFTVSKVNAIALEADSLKTQNTGFLKQMAKRDSVINLLGRDTTSLIWAIDSIDQIFKAKDRYIKALLKQKNETTAELKKITADSLYQYLQQVVYNVPGAKLYLFNELQMLDIQGDYWIAKNSEQIIDSLNSQVETCDAEVGQFKVLTSNLKSTITLQDKNINDCREIVANDSTIIDAQRRVIVKEVRRKNFWKVTTGVVTLIGTILII